MSADLNACYQLDILAQQAGGYFAAPGEQELEHTDLLFDVCKQFWIKYCSATAKERFLGRGSGPGYLRAGESSETWLPHF